MENNFIEHLKAIQNNMPLTFSEMIVEKMDTSSGFVKEVRCLKYQTENLQCIKYCRPLSQVKV